MNLIELVNENCSDGVMRDELQKALHVHHKPFSRDDLDVPFVKLEILIRKYMEKYAIGIQWIRMDARDGRMRYSAEVSTRDLYKPLVTINAATMYELYAKASLAMKWFVGQGNVETWDQVSERRWAPLQTYTMPGGEERSANDSSGTRKTSPPKNSHAKNSPPKKGGIYEQISSAL